jgi:hypothetical protein
VSDTKFAYDCCCMVPVGDERGGRVDVSVFGYEDGHLSVDFKSWGPGPRFHIGCDVSISGARTLARMLVEAADAIGDARDAEMERLGMDANALALDEADRLTDDELGVIW